ncbi:MAG: glycosyltransferase family 1 protein, partial [Patescibacteria group bacterium]
MRIGIDARFYAEAGGLGRYTRELIGELEKIDAQNEYLIFVTPQGGELYQPSNARFKKIIVNIRWYSWQEQIWWPLILRRQKIDLTHFLHWNVPLVYRGTFFLTIHDLILLRFPNRRASTLPAVFYWIKYLAHKLVLQSAARRARKIFVPSEFVKNDLIKRLGVAAEKIIVTYEGTGFTCHPRGSGDPASQSKCFNLGFPSKDCSALGAMLGMTISEPFLLYVGAAYPHKNLERLLEAFAILKNNWTGYLTLVLAGRPDYFYERLKHFACEKYPWLPIIFLGEVSDAELADLYQNASVFVFPSLSEGFGLPPLEAMAHGAPVLASNTSCLPEIL